ncbi:MAG: ABC transporter ATP-binding protein/permease [Rickettsiales bacterium]|jgi:subfamily B ATP-binding cassette protein MsbA|nr:ABC transporter ATP-binding protein/permease [Rickettsiales bacterium]
MLKKLKNKIVEFFRPSDKDIQIKWSLYWRVWREIGLPYWKWLLVGVIFTIIAASAEGYSITLVKQIIDRALGDRSMTQLYFYAALVVGAFSLKGIFNYAKSLVMSKAGLLSSAALKNKIHRHMMRMDITKFYGGGIGRHLNYFSVQATTVLALVTSSVVQLVQNIATMIITLGIMIYFAPWLCLILLVLAPGVIIPIILITRKKRKLSRQSFGIANDVTQQLNQSLQGMKTIQAFGNEDVESDRFAKVLDVSNCNAYRMTQASSLQSPLLEIIISVGLGLAMIIGGYFIISGQMTIGDFTAFLMALLVLYKPARTMTDLNGGIQTGLIAAEVLFDYLDTEPSIKDAPNAIALKPGKMSVKFDNVSFSYVPDDVVLSGVSLDIPAGSVCALVGPSGGGKTTILNLLERFYEPNRGKILINGTDIKKLTLNSLRKNIAEVSQDVFLFNGSVMDNIKYGAPNATKKQVEAAARAANAHNFIMDMPKKYDNIIGERGQLLSGGQKQRIAIARAILKDAPILLLDEATSALDTQSEKQIQAALKGLMVGRTTIVIAHRLSTILDADQICVIENGRVVERGTDSELVKLDGRYKQLRDIQFKKSKK